MNFEGHCFATGIGCLPMGDAEEAVTEVLNRLPQIPFWPQLPKRGFQEQMVPQYSEGFPGLVEDRGKERVYVDSTRALNELEQFYEREMADDVDAFAISPAYAVGLEPLIRRLREHCPTELAYVKGHVTGPITFGFTVKDEKGAAIFYDPNLADAVCRLMAMKALYQIRLFRDFHVPSIIFLDEPYMAAFGTTGMNITREDVVRSIDTVVAKIHQAEGIAGIHCCGNTDWSILFETGVDIVNFDAYDFMDRMVLYPDQISAFLDRGGNLAWGLVPTSTEAVVETAASLAERFRQGVDKLVHLGVDRDKLHRQCLITPACGMGSLSEEAALKNLVLLQELSAQLRDAH
jgi:methionine synthase II (cobalamin-independent)